MMKQIRLEGTSVEGKFVVSWISQIGNMMENKPRLKSYREFSTLDEMKTAFADPAFISEMGIVDGFDKKEVENFITAIDTFKIDNVLRLERAYYYAGTDSYQKKDELKKLGLKWSGKAEAWFSKQSIDGVELHEFYFWIRSNGDVFSTTNNR